MATIESVQASYRRFSENECRGYSELYSTLANAVADIEELAAFILPMPVIQPNLFLASVQYLTGPEGMPQSADGLRSLVRERGNEIAALMRARRTQTNEVGRCASILPALPPGPLALFEVGASAGLCLLPDAYFYDYGGLQIGPPASPVQLRCDVQGPMPSVAFMPQIVWRAGLDLAPVDLHNESDVRWLLSCVFADHALRRQRLAAAIKVCQTRPVTVHRGNLLTDLEPLISAAPPDAQLVVFHSAVLNYLTKEERARFARHLQEASKTREIVWISNEAPSVVPEITALAQRSESQHFLLGRTRFCVGERHDEFLAISHPHGAKLEWLAK